MDLYLRLPDCVLQSKKEKKKENGKRKKKLLLPCTKYMYITVDQYNHRHYRSEVPRDI